MEIKEYIISSANWNVTIDSESPKSAAISGLIWATSRFINNKLLMSTVIMVKEKDSDQNNFSDASFFPSHEIFNEIGQNFISEQFEELTHSMCNYGS
jgi:hypothetical protein